MLTLNKVVETTASEMRPHIRAIRDIKAIDYSPWQVLFWPLTSHRLLSLKVGPLILLSTATLAIEKPFSSSDMIRFDFQLAFNWQLGAPLKLEKNGLCISL